MDENLYQLYESCLSVWILDTYNQINKNKNVGSLKLLLKLRDIYFLKRLNYVVLNCRGDLKDPLVQFLLFLIELVDSGTHKRVHINTENKDKETLNSFRDNLTATDDNTVESALNTNTNTNRNSNTNQNSTNNSNRNKVFGRRFKQNMLAVVNTNLNSSKSNNNNDSENIIDGYVIFVNLFLCSLIPTLLYTYLNRVGNNKYNKLQLLHNYYNYAGKDNNVVNNYQNNNNSIFNYKYKFSNKVVVSKSFRNESERMVFRCKKFRNLISSVYSNKNKLAEELKAYEILFSSLNKICVNDMLYDNLNDLDNVSGLELVLYKLTLLLNNDFNNNNMYNELPKDIYSIYNKLSNKNILKNQIENNLIYCHRLRINDLNMKLNMNKIIKSLVKHNKNSNNNKYYNPGNTNIKEYNELNGFNDVDLLNVMSNSLLLFNNNLLYLNKFLGGNNNNNSNNRNSLLYAIGVNNVDRWLYFAYNIVNIINGNTIRNKDNNNSKNKNNKENQDNNNLVNTEYNNTTSIKYLYYILLNLMKHIFSLEINTSENIGDGNKNEIKMTNKYELFDLKVEGRRRVHLNNSVCLLILKLNYNFYKLLTINSCNDKLNNSTTGNKKDNNGNKRRDLTTMLTKLLDKIKLRMEYELFPTSYWLVSSQQSLLRFKLSSQCQSKPP